MNVEPSAPLANPPDSETARIRAVYDLRDHREPRHPALEKANGLINADRREQMRSVIRESFADRHPRLLDVGCGAGSDLEFWLASGWPAESVAGVDLVEHRVIE